MHYQVSLSLLCGTRLVAAIYIRVMQQRWRSGPRGHTAADVIAGKHPVTRQQQQTHLAAGKPSLCPQEMHCARHLVPRNGPDDERRGPSLPGSRDQRAFCMFERGGEMAACRVILRPRARILLQMVLLLMPMLYVAAAAPRFAAW